MPYITVSRSIWLIDFNLYRIQQLALLPRQESVSILKLILKRLHCLPVHFRIIFKILLLTYKALTGQALSYIRNLLTYKNSGRVLRSLNNQ